MKNNRILFIAGIFFLCCVLLGMCCESLTAIEYEIRCAFLEPIEGRIYYPGNKLIISIQLRDIDEKVSSLAFYVTPPRSKRPREPFFVDKDGSDGWFTTWEIPRDAVEGWYRISVQPFDKNGVRKGNEGSISIMIKKPEVRLRVTSPPRGRKFYGGQTVYVTGELSDRAGIIKRVDFYLYRASSEPPAEPTFSDKALSGGCSAKFVLPEKPLDQYVVSLRAYDSETGGSIIAEEKTDFLVTQPEVDLRVVEPRRGSYFYPGQQIHIYGELRDPAKMVKKVLFYEYASEGKKPAQEKESPSPSGEKGLKPFFTDENIDAGFSAQYSVPYDIAFGSHTFLVEAAGADEGMPALAKEEIAVVVKKPEIRMNVRVPSNGAYYYPGEDLYVNVELEDRASVVERVGFVIFPKGEPMQSTFTYFDKIFSDGCGTIFKLPEDVKPGKYMLQITAADPKGETLMQKTIEFEIRK